ncbi:MAG TPA: hypothetical protein VM370_02155 [Candidatus Thermoplasmatota archaeon]|nr:hypothetical protein [Candidatus Thermoplasmatota archaeon]
MAETKSLGRAVILPSTLLGAGYGVLGLFLSTFLGDKGALAFGLGCGWIAFTAGRALAFYDVPKGRGTFLRHILTGVAFGFAGVAFLTAVFKQGPGWPWTPWWILLAGFGWGLHRSHKALLADARRIPDDAPRVWGLFARKDLEALAVLVLGYGILGLAAFLVFGAFAGFIPGAGKMLTIAIAVYALQGARHLLAFASEDRGSPTKGLVGWLKANALQAAILVLVLVSYAAFRDQLAATMPFFPLVEFGLGVAIFGFVLARLRARIQKEGAPLATASTARDHERVITELREADYDAVARPVTRFVESGIGAPEYADALLASLPQDDPRATAVRARLAQHREPPRKPPIEIEWGFAAGAAMTAGLVIAALLLGIRLLHADMPYPLFLALMFVAFGVYAQQDVARSHHRHRLAAGIAAAGATVLLLDFALFVAHVTDLASLPGLVWGIAIGGWAAMVGFPAFASWRAEKKTREGAMPDARRLSPALEVAKDIQRTRSRAATMTLVAFLILLPVPGLAGWLAQRHIIPAGAPEFLDDVLAVAIWVIVAFGASALVRFYGLTRGRPQVLAREKAKRDRRLAVHKDIMKTLDQV